MSSQQNRNNCPSSSMQMAYNPATGALFAQSVTQPASTSPQQKFIQPKQFSSSAGSSSAGTQNSQMNCRLAPSSSSSQKNSPSSTPGAMANQIGKNG
jgi:hypothetical protein